MLEFSDKSRRIQSSSKAGKKENIEGYRSKVQCQPMMKTKKKTRREAVGQVILQALRRMREGP